MNDTANGNERSACGPPLSAVTGVDAVLPPGVCRPHLLVEVARLAVEQDLSDVAADCLQRLRAANTTVRARLTPTPYWGPAHSH